MKILQRRNSDWSYDAIEFYTDISNNSVTFAEMFAKFDIMKYKDINIATFGSFLNMIFDVFDKNLDLSRTLKMSLLEKVIIYFLNKNALSSLSREENIKKNIMLNNKIFKQFEDIKKFELPVLFI